MTALTAVLQELLRLPGATYCCAVEQPTGRLLGEAGRDGGDAAAVVPWGRSAAQFLAAGGDDLDDMMIVSRHAYHLVRRLGGHPSGPLLVYLRLDRSLANLALSRRELALVKVRDAASSPAGSPSGSDGPAALPRRLPARVPGPPPPVAMPTRVRGMPAPLVPAPRAAAGPDGRSPREGDREHVTTRWADDVGTMRRLLAGLKALR